MTWERTLGAVLLPGAAFWLNGQRILGGLVVSGYLLATLVFLAWLGRVPADVAATVMLTLHAAGIQAHVRASAPHLSFARRLITGLGLTAAVILLAYLPLKDRVESRWFFPLEYQGRVWVIHVTRPSSTLHRGDWLVSRLPSVDRPGVRVERGYSLERVLGLPGERVTFTPEACLINGVPGGRLRLMPESGGWDIPQNHWFVWPASSINVHGNPNVLAPAEWASLLRQMSTVSAEQWVGTPYATWFGRRQDLP